MNNNNLNSITFKTKLTVVMDNSSINVQKNICWQDHITSMYTCSPVYTPSSRGWWYRV